MTTHLGTNGVDKRSQIIELRNSGVKVAEIAKTMGLSKPSVYQYLKGSGAGRKTVEKVSTDVTTIEVTIGGTFRVSTKLSKDKIKQIMSILV